MLPKRKRGDAFISAQALHGLEADAPALPRGLQ